MKRLLSRRRFVAVVGGSAAGVGFSGRELFSVSGRYESRGSFPRQDPRLVSRVVQLSHFDLDGVRELVAERPALAMASWDWGFGDWETGLGAASHTGNREIAEHLMAHGARPTIFTFAMLGRLTAVRAMIEGHAGLQQTTGPHGLSLLHHARAGGDEAAPVVAYLEQLGDANPQPTDLPLTVEQRATYVGQYQFTLSGRTSSFDIVERRDRIAFRSGDAAPRDLLNNGNHEFHPVGVPSVRFLFEVRDGSVHSVAIRDGQMTVFGTRTD